MNRFSAVAAVVAFAVSQATAGVIPGSHIVVLHDGQSPDDVAASHGVAPQLTFRHALLGFAAAMPEARLEALRDDPRVAWIEPDQEVYAFARPGGGTTPPPQALPTGVDRIDGELSPTAAIDGTDSRVNVDIAIIDTGIAKHADLNLFKHVYCTSTGKNADQNGHGTHVAGTAAALDNGIGVVGVAPGARLWGVKVLNAEGSGSLGCIISGVDYVTANAASIEVANMSLGFTGTSAALDTALSNSVAAGVVYVVAAGNEMSDASGFSPANHPDVLTVSAIADFDGKPGGLLDQTVVFSICTENKDDSLACFSNYGPAVELAAPGVSIRSTWLSGGYNTISGTSMASPHAAGAAALYVATHGKPANRAGVQAVRDALIGYATPQAAPAGFTGDVDGSPEPLLDASPL